jgi:hypothetical protein
LPLEPARLRQEASAFVAAQAGQRIAGQRSDVRIDLLGNEGALACFCLDQPEVGEPLDGVADGVPRRVVNLAQLELGL